MWALKLTILSDLLKTCKKIFLLVLPGSFLCRFQAILCTCFRIRRKINGSGSRSLILCGSGQICIHNIGISVPTSNRNHEKNWQIVWKNEVLNRYNQWICNYSKERQSEFSNILECRIYQWVVLTRLLSWVPDLSLN